MSAKSPLAKKANELAMYGAMTRYSLIFTVVAGTLMFVGLVIFQVTHLSQPIQAAEVKNLAAPPLDQLINPKDYRTANLYLGLGLVLLALTPIIRVIVVLFYFFRERNMKYVAAAFGVLTIFIISVVLAWR